jgi:hypothetical protein
MISSSMPWIVEARCLAVTLAPLQQTMASQSAKGLGSGSVIAAALADVCFRVQSGKHLLAASISGFDPNVWSGRALQEVFVELSVCGLASMYQASDWSFCSGPSWISARVRSH